MSEDDLAFGEFTPLLHRHTCLMNKIVCDYFWLISCLFLSLFPLLLRLRKKTAKKNVFIRPKATQLFNNSFERRNFQLLLMVLQGACIHTYKRHTLLAFKDSKSNETLKKTTRRESGEESNSDYSHRKAFAASSKTNSRKLKRKTLIKSSVDFNSAKKRRSK